MKTFIYIVLLFLTVCNTFSQNDEVFLNNKYTIYDNEIVLDNITKRLTKLDRHYSITCRQYYKTKNKSYPFFVYDMVDTLNIIPNDEDRSIKFQDMHIYHIGRVRTYCKVSIILIPLNGKLYFFEGLNCTNKIHKIEDVLTWVNSNFNEQLDRSIIDRISNYEKYYIGLYIDNQGNTPQCKSVELKKRKNKPIPPKVVDLGNVSN